MDKNRIWKKDEINLEAQKLIGVELGEVLDFSIKKGNKGGIGQMVETQIYGLNNNSRSGADFKEAGVELKVIPLTNNKRNELIPKERMSLKMINYMKDYNWKFKDSPLYSKTKLMQIIQYHHNKYNIQKSKFIYQFMYSFPKIDIKIIENDYNTIINKIKDGKAHEISEGDTLYLGAARKGAGGERDLVRQPFSNIKAYKRAYTLKQNYLRLINKRISESNENIFKLASEYKKNYTFEENLNNKLKKFVGEKLSNLLQHYDINNIAKNAVNILIGRMLGLKAKVQNSNEFQKANITVKTVRIINDSIKEHMSFKKINFSKIKNMKWEDYWLYKLFNITKFSFIIF